MPLDPFFVLSPNPLFISTLDGRLLRVNPAFIAAIGHPEPTHILDLVHPADRPAAASAFAALAQGSPINGLQVRFRNASGAVKRLTLRTTPSLAEGLAYTVATLRNARNPKNKALGHFPDLCPCAIESSTDAFFAVDRDWRLTCVNRQAERLWNRSREALLGRGLWEAFPEARGGPFNLLFENTLRSGVPAHAEEFYPHPPHPGWFEVHAYPTREGLAVYFRDVTERHDAGERIRRTLQEKEVLLREVHHRVKNNLQVICSMLRLQERQLRDEALLQTLKECRERVMAMAMLHDQLHRARDFSNINLGEYIRNLAASLFCSYAVNSAQIGLRTDIDDIPVAMDTAIPCGLIVNELVSNSLRHAFPQGRRGRVSLALHALPCGSVELTIADDGCGFSENSRSGSTRSLGLWLVDLLSAQIGAAIERSNASGARFRLVFKETATPPPVAP